MNILIVDDDCLVAGALKTILEATKGLHVPACGSDGTEAVSLYRKFQPDVLLMDIRMKEMNGLEASAEILREFPDARILLLTTFSDDEYIIKALKLGAKGYLLKQDYQNIVPAIQAVFSGQTVFGNEIVSKIPSLLQKKQSFCYEDYDINDRELEIIGLIAEGMSNKEIASRLYLSEGTVRNYLSAILEKLNLRDRTQVAVFFYQHKS
ncbi:response regulator transcription factor [Faecalicatena sp. AGMB00832]|uniref:Response regulator transcription factor n=1 Tax=Faecalicatena faecalis TaxID=2726362 RepID=A0ABS6D1H2_9FIRM|nr:MULTISPECIES: response regulator transcription factor [Faecalicatena]MBU3875437.1 response regulator transcription factor [Faecalicatena faecalis]MCI6468018.1 response regulator transcription factor [Faecalicatena sp.]MDY5618495.1 response regulator transcription factor [Lachnospiraceae bacterium]